MAAASHTEVAPRAARFKSYVLPAVFAAAGIALMSSLGVWQLHRAAQKEALQARMDDATATAIKRVDASSLDAHDFVYYSVVASGTLLPEDTIYIDNRTRDGVPGYEVVTPLRIDGSTRHVLIQRGWIKAPIDRRELPEVRTPQNQVEIKGLAVPGDRAVFELSHNVQSGRVWQNITVERFRRAYNLDLQPFMIRERDDLNDGLWRNWPRPDAGADRNRAYAAQWFSMGVAILVIYVVLTFRKARRASSAA